MDERLSPNDISEKINEAFERYAMHDDRNLEKQFEEEENGPDIVDKILKNRRASREQLSLDQKASRLMNNFHGWWPSGMYREGDLGKIKLQRAGAQKLVSDLDSSIKAHSISDEQLKLVQTRAEDLTQEDRERKAKILATVFFDLIDMGYELIDLRR